MNEHNHYEPDGSDSQYSIEQDYGLEQGQDWFPAFNKQKFIEQRAEFFNYEFGKKGYAALEVIGNYPQWWREDFKNIGEVYGFLMVQGWDWNEREWVRQDERPEPPSNPFKQGDRVSHIQSGDRGVIRKVYEDWTVQVGYDSGKHEPHSMGELEPASPAPAFHQLPERQQEFLLALKDKKPVVKNGATRMALRDWGYIDHEDDWRKIALTPYGHVTIDLWREAVAEGLLPKLSDDTEAFVEAMQTGDFTQYNQDNCKHDFTEPDMFGNITCQVCGLNARVRKTETVAELPDLEPNIDDSIAATEPSYVGDGFTEEYAEGRDELGDHYAPADEAPDLLDLAQQMLDDETVNLTPELAELPTIEETIKLHTDHVLKLPPLVEDDLFAEHRFAKELEDLRAQVARLRQELDATQKYAKSNYDAWQTSLEREQKLQDELVEEQKVVIRQRQELEAFKDAKVTAAMNGKPNARAYVTKTLVQVIDPDKYGQLMSPLNLADDELMMHISTGWRIAHEEINSAFDPREDRIIHTRIVRVEQRPTPERPRRAEAKAEATPDPAEQIIFEAGEIVETAFTFEEALKSGKYSAEEMIEIGNAEVMATMKRTFEAQASSPRPFTPLPLFGKSITPVSQIIMEVSQDE